MAELKLSDAIKDHYQLDGKHPGKYTFKGREIDFSTCSLKDAETMHAMGFPGLKKKNLSEVKEIAKKDGK